MSRDPIAERENLEASFAARLEEAIRTKGLTGAEACRIIKKIREQLEEHRDDSISVLFNTPEVRLDTIPVTELAKDLNPRISACSKVLQDFCAFSYFQDRLTLIGFEDTLGTLKGSAAATGFKIGILAGVIYSGAPKEVVDRFERGLAIDCDEEN
jgi:hypothetical protein